MPVLLQVITDDFELTVWANDISKRQATYQKTLAARQLSGFRPQQAGVRLSTPAHEVRVLDKTVEGDSNSAFSLLEPLFFENTEYQFEWVFSCDVTYAELVHRRQRINDGFRFVPARTSRPAYLTGTIQTANDVGWMRLPLRYQFAERSHEHAISFEVLPTKMLLHSDLPPMYRTIDEGFPLWRFSLAEKTEQEMASSRQRGNFPLLWLAQFARLREQFELGLKVVCQAPHSRLQTHTAHLRADRLKGRIGPRLGERVWEDLANKQFDRRYHVEKKQLSVDTPENRFIKMVVSKSRKQLVGFEQRLRANNEVPDRQYLSEAFLQELHNWQLPMQKMLERSFLEDVGDYSGQTRESLVLQQKTGYSSIYRIWQELKLYLDVLAGQSRVSMKSVAEIYEIWCFLRIRQMLLDNLGFNEVVTNKKSLVLNEFFEYRLKDGLAGAFEFKRQDGVTARLAHEPVFARDGEEIRSYLITQKPDIVLEIVLPSTAPGLQERRFIWLFDAKYRIKTARGDYDTDDIDSTDYVPDDALNQMHRYRDALIALQATTGAVEYKSRPVFGAFALYPGHFHQGKDVVASFGQHEQKNPYASAIREVGIGAFPLLPDDSTGGNGSQWLLDFLLEQIGDGFQEKDIAGQLYVRDSARIPVYGMKQVLYPDLSMTAALGGAKGRTKEYMESFARGAARWFHMPESTFAGKFRQPVVEEVRYLALAYTSFGNSGNKQIDYVWPVQRVVLVPRYMISEEQSGKVSSSDEPYYLFELGSPLRLRSAVRHVPHIPIKNSMKLTTLEELEQKNLFRELAKVYPGALA